MTDALDRLKSALADLYTIEREIGHGGMAVVYLARDLKHECTVAIKVLRPELAAAQALSDREWFAGCTQNTMWQRGIIAGVLGDHDRAAELLRQAAETRDWFYFWDVRNTVLYVPFRDHPDFLELMRPKG